MKLGSFSHRSWHLQIGCPTQMSHTAPCWLQMKSSQVATEGWVSLPFPPLCPSARAAAPSGKRAATQLLRPHTLVQHFSKLAQSCAEKAHKQQLRRQIQKKTKHEAIKGFNNTSSTLHSLSQVLCASTHRLELSLLGQNPSCSTVDAAALAHTESSGKT